MNALERAEAEKQRKSKDVLLKAVGKDKNQARQS